MSFGLQKSLGLSTTELLLIDLRLLWRACSAAAQPPWPPESAGQFGPEVARCQSNLKHSFNAKAMVKADCVRLEA